MSLKDINPTGAGQHPTETEKKDTIEIKDDHDTVVWWESTNSKAPASGYMTLYNGDQTTWIENDMKVTILNNQHHLEVKGDTLTIIEIEGKGDNKKIHKTVIPISDLYRWEQFIDLEGDHDYIHKDEAYSFVCENPPDRGN